MMEWTTGKIMPHFSSRIFCGAQIKSLPLRQIGFKQLNAFTFRLGNDTDGIKKKLLFFSPLYKCYV